jgi:cytoskeleton-associated protein 5
MQVLSESLAWMAQAIEEFGLASLDVKLLIDWMITDLGSSNAGVRNSAIALLGQAHKQLGPGLVPMLSQHVKPALMTSLNEAFKANPLTKVRFHWPPLFSCVISVELMHHE